MNRNQRRGRVPRRNESANRVSGFKSKFACDVDGVSSPRPKKEEKSVANRCCYVSPIQKDFGQTTGTASPLKPLFGTQATDKYHNLPAEQYGYDPIIPDTISQLKELKKVLCGNTPKVENSSQYIQQNTNAYVETSDGSHWQNVDNIEDIEKFILREDRDASVIYDHLPLKIQISDVPRVKIIAEKFSKYKRNNLELRRLDEKVVCVEYDIFEQAHNDITPKTVQRMRAFFCIKPVFDEGREKKGATSKLPSIIKHKFEIVDEDLEKMTEKEIEIIDGKIEENQSYLEDLKRILKRKQMINAKKNKTSLDLQSLYEMAKKDRPTLDCDFSDANLLSKAELQEVKDLILQRCTSSVQGIRRRRVKRREGSAVEVGVISDSIVAELLRDDATLNVF